MQQLVKLLLQARKQAHILKNGKKDTLQSRKDALETKNCSCYGRLIKEVSFNCFGGIDLLLLSALCWRDSMKRN